MLAFKKVRVPWWSVVTKGIEVLKAQNQLTKIFKPLECVKTKSYNTSRQMKVLHRRSDKYKKSFCFIGEDNILL